MGALLESKEAFKARALEVNPSATEVPALLDQGTDTLARVAFAASPPGQSPSDAQLPGLFPGSHMATPGCLSSLKRLIFEAQTMVIADVKAKIARREDQPSITLAAEREQRIREQRQRLTGSLRGEEEVKPQQLRYHPQHDGKRRIALPCPREICDPKDGTAASQTRT